MILIWDKLYKRISDNEFRDLIDLHHPLTSDNIKDDKENQISISDKKILKKIANKYISNTNLSIYETYRYRYEICFGISSNDDDLNSISFYKFKDEWWLIETDLPGNQWFEGGSDFTYWIVDSNDGLKEWADDEKWKEIKKKINKKN